MCVCVCTRLTPEQHRFELHESTYVQIFFSIGNTTVQHNLQLVESTDREL